MCTLADIWLVITPLSIKSSSNTFPGEFNGAFEVSVFRRITYKSQLYFNRTMLIFFLISVKKKKKQVYMNFTIA